jgi:hypothetical protein
MDAVRKSAHLYLRPSNRLGYGIPDFRLAEEILRESSDENHTITVYPNPFKSGFKARYYSAEAQTATLYLTDALGRVIWQQRVYSPANYISEADIVPSQVLPQGIYILTIYTPEKVLTAKLIRD